MNVLSIFGKGGGKDGRRGRGPDRIAARAPAAGPYADDADPYSRDAFADARPHPAAGQSGADDGYSAYRPSPGAPGGAGYDGYGEDDGYSDAGRHGFTEWDNAHGIAADYDPQSALAAFGLAKAYGGRQVVKDVSLNVRRGEAVGLLGPNGAGKTTCFYMVTGLVKADAGRIMLDGHDVTPMPMYKRARLGIGYLPQEASIFRGLTVEGNIMGVLEVTEPDRRRRKEEMEALLEEFKITHVRKSPAIALSGGERRRVEIARALASRPSFMLLDEPFAGIDPIAVGDIQTLVRHLTTRGIGVLITDHNVRETLGLIDRAYIIHSGTVLMEGDPEAIVSSPDVRRLYLGEEFRL